MALIHAKCLVLEEVLQQEDKGNQHYEITHRKPSNLTQQMENN